MTIALAQIDGDVGQQPRLIRKAIAHLRAAGREPGPDEVLLFAGSRLRRRSRAGHPQHGTSETSADEAAAIRADLDISVAEAHLGAAMSALGTPPVVITSDVQTCDASPST